MALFVYVRAHRHTKFLDDYFKLQIVREQHHRTTATSSSVINNESDLGAITWGEVAIPEKCKTNVQKSWKIPLNYGN